MDEHHSHHTGRPVHSVRRFKCYSQQKHAHAGTPRTVGTPIGTPKLARGLGHHGIRRMCTAAQKVCSGSHGRIAHNGLSCHLCHSPGHVFRPFFLKHLLRPSTHWLAFSHFNCYSFFFFSPGGSCFILFDSLPLCFQSVPAFTSLMPGHRHP